MKEGLEDKIYQYIKRQGHISFIELSKQFPKYFKGSRSWEIKGFNIVLWIEMTKSFINALRELLNKQMIFMNPTSLLLYLTDGGGLMLPLVKRPPKNGYKDPHWLPVVFHTSPTDSNIGLDWGKSREVMWDGEALYNLKRSLKKNRPATWQEMKHKTGLTHRQIRHRINRFIMKRIEERRKNEVL